MHLVKKLIAISVLLSASVQAQNILEFPQPENNPEEFYAVTEIPAGGMIKYETDAKTGFIVADRFQSMPVAYPANYGSLTQSLAGDGDPLDVLVVTPHPVEPGSVIRCRPVGKLNMEDDGGIDAKLIAVPHEKLTPLYKDVQEYTDLPELLIKQVEHFFAHYKDLEPGKWVKISGWEGADVAKAEVLKAIEAAKK